MNYYGKLTCEICNCNSQVKIFCSMRFEPFVLCVLYLCCYRKGYVTTLPKFSNFRNNKPAIMSDAERQSTVDAGKVHVD